MTALPALGLLALLFATGDGSEPRLTELAVHLDGQRVAVDFALRGAFGDELVERIETGLPTGFDYQFRLVKDFKFWWDQDLDETTVQVFASYDAVAREYLVNLRQDGRLIESKVLRTLQELEAAMTRFAGLHLFTLEGSAPRRRLLIKARAKLGDKTLLRILPTTDATGWVESSKFRPPS